MKLKYNLNKQTYSITGLTYDHLMLLSTLIDHVRLGTNTQAFDFAELFENELIIGNMQLRVSKGETGKYVKDPVIEV
jgi:predicted solute-binding protein